MVAEPTEGNAVQEPARFVAVQEPARFVDPPPNPHTLPPPGSWDTMCHAFGSYETYPMSDRPRLFTPPEEANFASLRRMHKGIGIDRGVVIQPTCYGTDNRVTVDAVRAGEGRYIGIALIDDSVSDAALADLHSAGIRGARFHAIPWLNFDLTIEELASQIERMAPLGWVVNLHIMPEFLLEHEKQLSEFDIPFAIDHMMWLRPGEIDHPAIQAFQRLQDRGNWWIKLSNTERISTLDAGFTDIIPLMRTLVSSSPDRVMWGTDWAHTMMKKAHVAADREILELLFEAIPDEGQRHKILVDNPAALYDQP